MNVSTSQVAAGAFIEYHEHQWTYRAPVDGARYGTWACTHVNGDETPCSTVVSDFAGIPHLGPGMHMYQTGRRDTDVPVETVLSAVPQGDPDCAHANHRLL